MTTPPPRAGGRTHLDIDPDQLVWALYGRESFDGTGDAEQVTNQLADMRTHVAGVGGTIGKEFPENNVSAFRRVRVLLPDGTYGYRVVRPDWDAMMTALRRGHFNALCLPNIDRGMRDPRDLEDLIDLVEHYGVYVTSMTGTIDLTTDEGISSARHEVNQRNQESRNMSRRMQTGNRRAAMKGRNSGGGTRPFGWRNDRVRVNKREAKHILREIPRLLSGVRPATIAVEWNERGIPTVSGKAKWRAMTIVQIFTNPRLCGWKIYRDEVLADADGNPVKGVWEPIITEEQHHALITAIRPPKVARKNRGRGHTMKYLLSPFIRCGKCNARMYGGIAEYSKKTGEPVVVYRCPAKGWGGCNGVARQAVPFDEAITALVQMEQAKIKLRKAKEVPPWDKEDELRDLMKQIKECTEAYKAKRITGGRFFALIEDLERDESRLKAEKRKHEAKRETRAALEIPDLADEWGRPDFTLEQKHAAIAKSIKAIIIHPASRRGRVAFDPDKDLTIVWNDEDE
ncbi:recombinase family protein [Nonomuraea sp. B19D2]|uniref:recombinase family protein n=1 Tax=Nonomuraea sp. B19D2 TaxID=3159561 RepID=UPI0032DA7402